MTYRLRGQICLVGVAESSLGRTPDRTVLSLQMEAAAAALADAGLAPSSIDGLMVSGYPYAERQVVLVGEYLGLNLSYVDATNVGGAGFVAAIERAGAAILAGLCQVVLVSYGSTQYSSRTRTLGAGRAPEFGYQFEVPYGPPIPIASYAMAAQRHMHLYGTTSEQLAEIAVSARGWARLNPRALRRDPLTVADVLASPMICDPLHQLDCCLVTDGGGAVILTSAEIAATLPKPPVYVLGSGYAQTHESIMNMPDLTVTAARDSGRLAFDRAGLRPSDVDVAQIYDSFTITTLLSLEDLGFCARGEGGPFVSGGRVAPAGSFPMNTTGGGLSYCHPGMFGIFLLIEAVRQLRGECGERQVAGARVALCHGTGGQLSTGATVVLSTEKG
jgi:acetyl-CoA acetyltransferase